MGLLVGIHGHGLVRLRVILAILPFPFPEISRPPPRPIPFSVSSQFLLISSKQLNIKFPLYGLSFPVFSLVSRFRETQRFELLVDFPRESWSTLSEK